MARQGGDAGRGAGGVGLTRPADYDDLPRRFKDYVRALEARVHDLEAKADRTEPTDVWLKTYDRDAPRYLPGDARVVFRVLTTGPGPHPEVEVTLRDGNDGLVGVRVRTDFGRLSVLPCISNEVVIQAGRL